jgi:hypothetical protein
MISIEKPCLAHFFVQATGIFSAFEQQSNVFLGYILSACQVKKIKAAVG